ncbi:MAG TPA: trypsin-like peptidase domain-containing protein, partial [Abditibacteriaceae bacterium]
SSTGVSKQSGNAIVQAVRLVGPAVVNVDTEFGREKSGDFLPDPSGGTQPQQGKGTGVVFDTKRGLMLTNAHVVAGADKIQVTTRDGDQYTGKLLGSDRMSDIAVVVLSNKTLKQAKLAPMTDARKDLAIGEWAIAIGNPFAQANTVTVGVVSAVGRTIPVPGGKDGQSFQLTDMIQTDAAINPGNSGGPLCNIDGEVIGINTAIIPFGTGLGFTIPINKAMAVADQLIKKGKVQHPYVGIRMLPITEAVQKDFGMKDRNGALVQGVEKGSPADKAGIQSGDVIRALDGKAIKDSDEVQRLVAKKKVGDVVKIEVLRNNSVKKTLTLKIGDRPQ